MRPLRSFSYHWMTGRAEAFPQSSGSPSGLSVPGYLMDNLRRELVVAKRADGMWRGTSGGGDRVRRL